MQSVSSPTSATKKRATTLEDLISLCCIQDFLTAIRSAKWLPAERMPMNNSTGPSGRGGAFHLLDFSRSFCGAKLGCDVGKDAAKMEWTSTSPFKESPVASSRENPCEQQTTLEQIHITHETIGHLVAGFYSQCDKEMM